MESQGGRSCNEPPTGDSLDFHHHHHHHHHHHPPSDRGTLQMILGHKATLIPQPTQPVTFAGDHRTTPGKKIHNQIPKNPSMNGISIFTYMYQKDKPHVGKYIPVPWMVWEMGVKPHWLKYRLREIISWMHSVFHPVGYYLGCLLF